MKIHEKIRFIRQQHGWSQEEMAVKLNMSSNGYGNIERGDTDVNLSRLEEIAAIFNLSLSQLFSDDEDAKNVFYLSGTNNSGTLNNYSCCRCYFANAATAECNYLQLKFELEKQKSIDEQKEKEITLLKEMNRLLKKDAAS